MLFRPLPAICIAFLENRDGIERFLRHKTGCDEAGKDLAQETWLRVQQAAPGVPIENPVAYLFRIAGNLAIDWLRQERARSRRLDDAEDILERVATPAPGPDEAAQAGAEFEALCAAIRELPPKCREVFLLYRAEGLRMREIADFLGIAEKTVEHHLARAMLHCRRRVREAGREGI